MSGKYLEKYLVVKAPDYTIYHYDCHGHDAVCTCINMPIPVPPISTMIIPYFKGYLNSDEMYEKLKKKNLIVRETTDHATAAMLNQQLIDELQEMNDRALDEINDSTT